HQGIGGRPGGIRVGVLERLHPLREGPALVAGRPVPPPVPPEIPAGPEGSGDEDHDEDLEPVAYFHGPQPPTAPPLMGMVWPVRNDAAGDASQRTAAATSSG